jgi:hypothetical protein
LLLIRVPQTFGEIASNIVGAAIASQKPSLCHDMIPFAMPCVV